MKKILIAFMAMAVVLSGTGCKKKNKVEKLHKTSVVLVNGEEHSYKTGELEGLINNVPVESLVWKSGSISGMDIAAMQTYCKESLKELDMEKINFAKDMGSYSTDVSYHPIAYVSDAVSIPYAMCYGFKVLERVVLPKATRSIEDFAFASCTNLSEVVFGPLESMDSYCFLGAPLTDLTLPEGLKSLKAETFYNCPLERLVLPSTLCSIFDDTFLYNTSLESKLKEVIIYAKDPPAVGRSTVLNKDGSVFGYVSSSLKIKVPKGCVAKYNQAPNWRMHDSYIVEMD